MNRVFIITFDLENPTRNRATVLKRIKAFGAWARLSRSAYLISTNKTAKAIRDSFDDKIYRGDKLYVGAAPSPSAWRGLSEDVSNWILANQ